MNNIKNLLEPYKTNNKNRLAIYTAVTNDYDNPFDPLIKSEDIDYYFFSDNLNNIKSNLWNKIKINFKYRDPRRLAKIFKLFPHYLFPKYKFSLWIDGNIQVTDKINILVDNYLKNKHEYILFSKHQNVNIPYLVVLNIFLNTVIIISLIFLFFSKEICVERNERKFIC